MMHGAYNVKKYEILWTKSVSSVSFLLFTSFCVCVHVGKCTHSVTAMALSLLLFLCFQLGNANCWYCPKNVKLMISRKTPLFLFLERSSENVCRYHFQPLRRASTNDGLMFCPLLSDILKNKVSPPLHTHTHTDTMRVNVMQNDVKRVVLFKNIFPLPTVCV